MAAIRARALRDALRRHPYHAALAALAAGLACAPAPVELSLALAGSASLALACVGLPAQAVLAPVLVLAGSLAGEARLRAVEPVSAGALLGEPLERRAILLEHPRPGRFGSAAAVQIESSAPRAPRLLAAAPRSLRWPRGAGPGSELVVAGRVRPLRAAPGASFDRRAYLRRRGISAELTLDRVRATGRRRGGLIGAIDRMRERAELGLSAGASPAHAALVRGMVLGQDESIAPHVREDFRRSGLAHLLAVSGQNVALLCALALPLVAVLGLGPRARALALMALVGLYVPLAGAGPSLQRAAVMGGAGLAALLAGRPSSRWYALGLAAVVTLALDPRVSGDVGWQLSFTAVVGIMVLGPGLRSLLSGLPRALAEGIALTMSATLATAPLLAHHFGTVSLAGLGANVLALPVVAPIMWLGMLQATAGQMLAAPWASALVRPALEALGALNSLPLAYLVALAGRAAIAPGADLPVRLGGAPAVAGGYALLVAATVAAHVLGRRLEPDAASGLAAYRRAPRSVRLSIVLSLAALAAGLAAFALAPSQPPDRLTVSFLDVGQGDATLVQHPGGAAVLFDGGPREARIAGLLRGAGVRRLSAVVATHASADHHGGLVDVLERLPVDLLLEGGDGSANPTFRSLLATADRRGVRRMPARAGQTLRAGGLAIRILSPAPRPPGPAPEDPNPRAVAAVVESQGFSLFLSGDAESDALGPLRLPAVDAIKVSHHGSGDPGLPGLLRRLRPQVAAIEVGAHNGYGHPHPATLAALRAAVPGVYRTDLDGTVRLTVGEKGIAVDTEH